MFDWSKRLEEKKGYKTGGAHIKERARQQIKPNTLVIILNENKQAPQLSFPMTKWILVTFYRWRIWGTEKSSNLPKVVYPGNCWYQNVNWAACLQGLSMSPLQEHPSSLSTQHSFRSALPRTIPRFPHQVPNGTRWHHIVAMVTVLRHKLDLALPEIKMSSWILVCFRTNVFSHKRSF